MAAKAATDDNTLRGKAMAGGIFISYRRDDNRYAAGRFYDRLAQHFGAKQIFMDVDNIEPGLDFVKVLNERVGRCDVLVAIIGPGWLEARDAEGRRRFDNPDDFVRIEIEAALARDVRVVPLLVEGAQMPREADLPETLRPLARRNACTLTHATFGRDAEALIRVLEKDLRSSAKGWFKGWSQAAAPSGSTAQPITRITNSDNDAPPKIQLFVTSLEPKGRVLFAGLFALLSLPLVVGTGGLFTNLHWSAFRAENANDGPFLTGALTATCSILLISFSLAVASRTKSEKLFYFIASTLCVSAVAWPVCDILQISFLGPGEHGASGKIAAGFSLCLCTAIIFGWWQRQKS